MMTLGQRAYVENTLFAHTDLEKNLPSRLDTVAGQTML